MVSRSPGDDHHPVSSTPQRIKEEVDRKLEEGLRFVNALRRKYLGDVGANLEGMFADDDAPLVTRQVFYGLCAGCGVSVLSGVGAGLVCHIAGFLYPMYRSFKALKEGGEHASTQHRHWLSYWFLFGASRWLEYLLKRLVPWIPFYHALKLGFSAWAMMPRTHGAEFFFQSCAVPFMNKYEAPIDREFAAIRRLSSEASESMTTRIRQIVAEGIHNVSEVVKEGAKEDAEAEVRLASVSAATSGTGPTTGRKLPEAAEGPLSPS